MQCIDTDLQLDSTADTIMYENTINLIKLESKSLVLRMKNSLNNFKQSIKNLTMSQTTKFDLCVNEIRGGSKVIVFQHLLFVIFVYYVRFIIFFFFDS